MYFLVIKKLWGVSLNDRFCLELINWVGQLLSRHLENILTSCLHRITKDVAEGLNIKIMSINR